MKKRKKDDFNNQDDSGRGIDNRKNGKSEPNDDSDEFDEFLDNFPKDLAENFISRIVHDAAKDIYYDILKSIRSLEDPPIGRKVEKRNKITIDAVLAYDEPEQFPGTTRNSLAVQGKKHTFGTSLCKSLTDDLKEFYDDLLFGLIDNIYLHHLTSFSFDRGDITIKIKVFWGPRESPHRLLTPKVTDIIENQELVYLIVGDLVEDLLNRIEEEGRKERCRQSRNRSPRKRRR